jgi:hypothetical protein
MYWGNNGPVFLRKRLHMHKDAATDFIIRFLRSPRQEGGPSYGYDVWLPSVITDYIRKVEGSTDFSPNLSGGRRAHELAPFFFEAAWDMCIRGVLRPGIKSRPNLADGAGIDGYRLTSVGREMITDRA